MTSLTEVLALEEALHRPDIRRSRQAVEALLADDFVEFGSSGTTYSRAEMIALLIAEDEGDGGALRAYDYALTSLAADAVLLTYRTTRVAPGEPERHVLRSSIWVRSAMGWRMRFHQGTVTQPAP